MIEIRILKEDEYDMLGQVPEPDRMELSPDNTVVAVAMDGDRLVGRLAAINLPHIEFAWIDPQYRGGTVLGRLESSLVMSLRLLGAKMAIAYATNEEMESLVKRLGYARLASAWRKDL